MTHILPIWFSFTVAIALAGALGVIAGVRLRIFSKRYEGDDFFEQIRDAALITEDGAILGANQGALDLFGYSRSRFIGLPVASLLTEAGDEARFVQALMNGPVKDLQLRLRTATGEIRECAVTASARFDGDGNLIGCRGLARDVTDRNRILAELRRAEQDYRGLFENAHDAILILDPFDETVLDVNARACILYGFPRESFVGRSMAALSVDPARGEALLRQTRSEGGQYTAFESRQCRGDGSLIDVEIHAATVSYRGRQVILSINRDVSDRRRVEKAVRDSEARFRLLLESVTDYAIAMLDPAGCIVSWNEGAQRITGYRQEEVVGRTIRVFAAPEEANTLVEDLAAAVANGKLEREVVRVRKDGSRFAASVTLTPMVDETFGLRGFAEVTHDITERQQLETARREILAILRDVAAEWTGTFDAVQVPIVLLDAQGQIRRLNRAAQSLGGQPFAQIVRNQASSIENEPWPTVARVARDSFQSGRIESARATSGDAVWQVSSSLTGSSEGERLAIVVAYDLTLVTRLEASLRESEVAAAMGTMVVAVAHEVRNPLFTISATVDACRALYGEHEGVSRYGGSLLEQVHRLNRLMADLLEFGKPNPLDVQPESLNEAIKAAARHCEVVASQVPATILVESVPELPPAAIDRSRIEQVFQNVIDNALRHSPAGGTVRVETTIENTSSISRIIDEGPGVDSENLDSVFVPFFTRRRGGTGLGLAIARKIVNGHGGEISLANREGTQGTVVTIRLPLATADDSELHLRVEAH